MKKINPQTNSIYKRGDLNSDGTKRFWSYKTGHINEDGYFSMSWKLASQFSSEQRAYNKKQRAIGDSNTRASYPKRLNPKTNRPFVMGDTRDDGLIFCSYSSRGKVTGNFRGELWARPEAYLRYRVGLTLGKIERRAKKKKIKFNLTLNHLMEILPDEMVCPILGIEMKFGGDNNNSPSVDRLFPQDGYVIGNVTWVSKLANTFKSDRTPNELRQIADWIEALLIWQKHNQSPMSD